MTELYKVESGDCAWKFAEKSLKRRNNNASVTNTEIAQEMQRLAKVYDCENVDSFNRKYFSKVGNEFEIKADKKTNEPKSQPPQVRAVSMDSTHTCQNDAIPDTSRFVTNIDTIAHKTLVDSLRLEDMPTRVETIQAQQDRINNLPTDKEKVVAWNKEFNKDNKDNYIIIDKKECMAYVYSPDGKVVKQYEIAAARNKSDALLKRSYTDKSYSFKSTSAGIYTANYRATGRDDYAKLYNDRVLQLSNDGLRDRGIGNGETGVALHQVPNGNKERERKLKLPGVSDENNRTTDGCVNFLPEDFDDCMSHVKGVGTKVYILPEDSNNYMCVKNGELHFAQKKYTGDVATTVTKKDNCKKISINVLDSDIGEEGVAMAITLADKKEELMEKLGVDNDTYNMLAKVALGIAGQETDFGSAWAGAKKGTPYWMKEGANWIINFGKWVKGDNSYNSRGMTQMKIKSYTDENVKALINEYGITEENLQNGDKCAIATMIVLAHMYKNELPALKGHMDNLNLSKEDALLYCWNNKKSEIKNETATPDKSTYLVNAHNYMNDFEFYYT